MERGLPKNTPSELEPRKKIEKRLTMDDIFRPPIWSKDITFPTNEGQNIQDDLYIYRSLKQVLNTEKQSFSVDKNQIIVKANLEAVKTTT